MYKDYILNEMVILREILDDDTVNLTYNENKISGNGE